MDIRKKFLDFFARKGHSIYDSMPLVSDDASLLFTNAGMVQFKDIFTGKIPAPENKRATSSQLCMRAGGKHNDLDNVGYTARHHTLFEMLGNFSFGDYFKSDAIDFAWEFITQELGFEVDKIYVSVHYSDDEAYDLWKKYVAESRIKKMGDEDNFWQMGDTGPCGPCSEIYIDQGAENFSGKEDYFGGEGDRFLEIWNLVFMQYERDKDGNLKPLPKPSIDTGMGLERVTALLENKQNNFDTSLFAPIINECVKLTQKPYAEPNLASHRVIADHSRSITFLLAQGVNFDKEGRGYVLRRILRRAARHGYLLGLKEAFLYKLVGVVCENLAHCYPYLTQKKAQIQEQCKAEEERFLLTIESGMDMFKKELSQTSGVFSGEVAFKLYDTYGFPLDLTQDMLKEQNLSVDIDEFDKCMEKQKTLSKSSWKGGDNDLESGEFNSIIAEFGENEFVGYESDSVSAKVLALLDSSFKRVDKINANGYVFLDKTPLYAEGGGPVGDSGELRINGKKVANVLYTKKYFGLNISEVRGNLSVGDEISVIVDKKRQEISKHHTATHLLHASLRKILGEHISQAGSLVEDSRLRFDFTHNKALSGDEIEKIENEVNSMINLCLEAKIELVPIAEANKRGAMALFGEKYGEIVRMISFGDVSCELCGGIHASNTAFLGNFYITRESSVSSGVRRIEAVCGKAGYAYARENLTLINNLKETLKSNDILAGISKLRETISTLKGAKSNFDIGNYVKNLEFEVIGDSKLIIAQITSEIDLKLAIDDVKRQNQKVAVLFISQSGEKISVACGVKGIDSLSAKLWVKEVCSQTIGGGGGGRDDFATAGGKDASKIPQALIKAREFVLNAINGASK